MSPKILVVDDEPAILSSLRRLLKNEGYEVQTTESTQEALELFSAGEEFAVVLSDQRMPEMSGTDFLAKIQTLQPDTIRMLLTWYPDVQTMIDAINKGRVARFLSKPWDDDELRQILKLAVLRYELGQANQQLHQLALTAKAKLEAKNRTLEKSVTERTQRITHLNKDLHQSLLGSIQMIAGLSEMHSMMLGSHSKRVATLTRQIAERLGITGWDLLQIVIAATLHDIGKIGISTPILKQEQGLLTPREAEILKRHAVKGEALLLKMHNLQDAARIIRHHHEHFNGTGYPDHLAGENIPIGARIIAVTDAYDKALNPATHFSKITPETALLFIRSQSPMLFDPNIVSLLGTILAEDRQAGHELEMQILPKELTSGMVLSRDLVTVRGVLVLQKDTCIQPSQSARVKHFLENDPAQDGIYVYRNPKVPCPTSLEPSHVAN